MWQPAEIKQIPGNIFSLFDDGWALLTAGDEQSFNTMTVSWGQAGWLWNRPVVTAYVRKSRYTLGFTERCGRFSLSFFTPGQHRRELGVLGSQSGRDMDKMHQSGLTPILLDGQHAFDEAHTVLVCRTLYSDWVDPARFRDPAVFETSYPDAQDVHRIYVAEVCSAFVRK